MEYRRGRRGDYAVVEENGGQWSGKRTNIVQEWRVGERRRG